MKILRLTWRYRRDFQAIYICEYCDAQEEVSGYDDRNFHDNVVPYFVCKNCGKSRRQLQAEFPDLYPDDNVQTKYPDYLQL